MTCIMLKHNYSSTFYLLRLGFHKLYLLTRAEVPYYNMFKAHIYLLTYIKLLCISNYMYIYIDQCVVAETHIWADCSTCQIRTRGGLTPPLGQSSCYQYVR